MNGYHFALASRSGYVLAVLLAATLQSACRTTEAEAPRAIGVARATSTDIPVDERPTRFVVAEEIRRTCDIDVEDERAPHFELDSAQLRPRGRAIVDAIGACLTAGPLAGRRISITGHTDRLGAASYNEQLGLYRAIAAKLRLEEMGVAPEAVIVRSRGERDARATAEDEDLRWMDRRVEVELLEPKGSSLGG